MASYIRAILLTAITLYFAVIYKSTSLALLGFSEAVFVVLSFLLLLYQKARLNVRLELPVSIVDCNQEVHLYTVAENTGILPVGKIRYRLKYPGANKNKQDKIWTSAENIPIGSSKNFYTLTIANSGNYEFVLRKIRIYDPTGFFYFTKSVSSKVNAMVLPPLHQVPISIGEGVRNFFGDSDFFDELRPGYDPCESFDVREFKDGDKIQSIHWKLSAKTDELVVKENSLPKACPIVLFLYPETAEDKASPEWIASISYSLMDTDCPHYAAWFSKNKGEIIRARVDDTESFYLFLTTYMQDCGNTAPEPLPVLYAAKYRGEQYLHTLSFEAPGKICLDGKTLNLTVPEELELVIK